MNEEAARQTVIALETYEEKLALWQGAYDELYAKAEAYRLDSESRRARMASELKALEAAYNAELKAARRKSRSPGLGLFVGGGYGSGERFSAVVGLGVVWKIF